MLEPLDHILAFVADAEPRGREVRINFGLFAGRTVTPAEIDDLAKLLIPTFGHVSIIAEERHELSDQSEVSVQQVRLELPEGVNTDDVIAVAERWAQACIDERSVEISEA
jgi:hypothetical protein